MTTLLVDTSVLIKWFHSDGESQVAEARALREATRGGDLETRVIDLALYEMGNVLLRSLHWSGSDVADQLASAALRSQCPATGSAGQPSSGQPMGSRSMAPAGPPQAKPSGSIW